MMAEKRTIVVSGVNIRKGGTLTIMRDCLEYLSGAAGSGNFRIIALVHDRALFGFPGIEYVEMPDTIRNWGKRLWCEYVTMKRISRQIGNIDLWLSLHDTTPNVCAKRQAVYCQTSFPFLKWKMRDFRFDYKIPLFAMLTRFAYRINIHRNRYIIVQQEWMRHAMSRLLKTDEKKIIIAAPEKKIRETVTPALPEDGLPTFIYASTPDCHKNFETLCEAARLLEQEIGPDRFRLILTINGKENSYSRWLLSKWGEVSSISFSGFLSKEELFARYAASSCLVFPSRVETWGLPISEYLPTGHPMILADLPYAHETAAGSSKTAFFPCMDALALKDKMKDVADGNLEGFYPVEAGEPEEPLAGSWKDLFELLLSE